MSINNNTDNVPDTNPELDDDLINDTTISDVKKDIGINISDNKNILNADSYVNITENDASTISKEEVFVYFPEGYDPIAKQLKNVQEGGGAMTITLLVTGITVGGLTALAGFTTYFIGKTIFKIVRGIINHAMKRGNTDYNNFTEIINKEESNAQRGGGLAGSLVKSLLVILITKACLKPREIIEICMDGNINPVDKLKRILTISGGGMLKMGLAGAAIYGLMRVKKGITNKSTSSVNQGGEDKTPLDALTQIKEMMTQLKTVSQPTTMNPLSGGSDNNEIKNIETIENIETGLDGLIKCISNKGLDKYIDELHIDELIPPEEWKQRTVLGIQKSIPCKEIYQFYKDKLDMCQGIISNDLKFLANNPKYGDIKLNRLMKIAFILYTKYNKIVNIGLNKNNCGFRLPLTYGYSIRKYIGKFQVLQREFTQYVKANPVLLQQRGGNKRTYIKTNIRVMIEKNKESCKTRVVYKYKNGKYVRIDNEYVSLSNLKKKGYKVTQR